MIFNKIKRYYYGYLYIDIEWMHESLTLLKPWMGGTFGFYNGGLLASRDQAQDRQASHVASGSYTQKEKKET